jgi:ABC-type branched-subunit amino acid transport system substrate-binding protein
LKEYPQFSPRSTSSKLDDTDQFPLFGRLVPSDDGTAIAVVLHFQKLGVTHFGVIHTDDEYGVQYANSLQKAALGTDMKILTFRIPANRENATPEELRSAVTKLKESNYRYFFGVIHGNSHYVPVMEEAVSQGIAGTGMHNWYFADGVTATTLSLDQYEKYLPLYNATRGDMLAALNNLSPVANVCILVSIDFSVELK